MLYCAGTNMIKNIKMKRFCIMLAISLTAATGTAQTKRMAVTNLSEVNLRENPEYTAELGSQALMGTVVEIKAEKGYWRQTTTPEPESYTAWCTEPGLTEMKHDRLAAYIAAPKYICTVLHSSVRLNPSESAQQVSDLSMGDLVRIVMTEGKKPKPSVKKGWAEVMLPSGTKGWTPLSDIEEMESWAAKCKAAPETVTATAKRLLGVPYLWGGASSKGLDCSGLTRLVWFMNGMLIPRNASQQAAAGREVVMQANHGITPDSGKLRAEMQNRIRHIKPGDLIFFGTPETFFKKESVTHVGIYLGNGKFIHSSHYVRISSLIPGDEDYYDNSYKLIKARRLFAWEGESMLPITKSPAYFMQNQ